jgi:putative ABC transport system permease protein
MRVIGRMAALSIWTLRCIPQRWSASITTVVSVMCVVGVLIALLSMGEGIRVWSTHNARPDRVVILSKGATDAVLSVVSRQSLAVIKGEPLLKKDSSGQPLVDASSIDAIDVVTVTNERGSAFLVGTTNPGVYPEVQLTTGRWPRPGLHEVVVSSTAQRLYRGLNVGDHLSLRGANWFVVGCFGDTGGFFDQSLLTNTETMLSAFGRNSYQRITAILAAPGDFMRFRDAVVGDPAAGLVVYSELESRENDVRSVRGFLDFVSYFVGTIMASGAVCAAVSSLYAAVDARRREIVTLRALGFGAMPIMVSILVEGIALCICGAFCGALIAWVVLNGRTITTHDLTFPLDVSSRVVIVGILWATMIALVGGILPALRALRLSVATAMRAV